MNKGVSRICGGIGVLMILMSFTAIPFAIVQAQSLPVRTSEQTTIQKKHTKKKHMKPREFTARHRSVQPHAYAPRGDTFAQFYSRLSKRQQQCVQKSFSSAVLHSWLKNSDATLTLSQVAKVTRCTGGKQ